MLLRAARECAISTQWLPSKNEITSTTFIFFGISIAIYYKIYHYFLTCSLILSLVLTWQLLHPFQPSVPQEWLS